MSHLTRTAMYARVRREGQATQSGMGVNSPQGFVLALFSVPALRLVATTASATVLFVHDNLPCQYAVS